MASKVKRSRVKSREIFSGASRRVTAQRAMLLDLIRQSTGHVDAYDLYHQAREKQARISLSTVYRNLHLFKKLGLIEEHHFAEEHHHYEAKPATEHQHLICLNCGKVVEFSYSLSSRLKREISKQCNCDVSMVEVNVSGLCSACRKEKRNDTHR
jgi:Fur family ferric uptake transcriptional regulator